MNSAAEVMTFIVEPGATCAVSAKSLDPALLATAMMCPVDGWMTTIELFACIPTADRAAASALESIVVARLGMSPGVTICAWLARTGSPLAFCSSTFRPGVPPSPGGAWAASSCPMWVSPASP